MPTSGFELVNDESNAGRNVSMANVWVRSALFAALQVLGAQVASAGETTGAAELAFNNHCRECHMIDKGDNRVGPSLCGVIGRKAGTEAGFQNYSAAIQDSGIVWDAASLDKWMTNQNAFLPGNNMNPFPGVDDPAQRALIISYLTSHACR